MQIIHTPQQVVRRSVIICIVSVIILTSAAAVISYLIASGNNDAASSAKGTDDPIYETSSLILAQKDSSLTGAIHNQDSDDKVNTSDTSSSVAFSNTVAAILEADPEMKSLISDANIDIEPVKDSYLIRITASSSDPKNAANTANQVAHTAPQIYHKYFESGKISVVEDADIPSNPVSEKESKQNTDILPIVLISALSAFSAGILLAIILTAAVYSSHKKKYASALKNYYELQK